MTQSEKQCGSCDMQRFRSTGLRVAHLEVVVAHVEEDLVVDVGQVFPVMKGWIAEH